MATFVLEARQTGEQSPARQRLIDGNDLMESLDLPSGPQIGELLSAVEEAAAEGEVTTREEALALAARLTRERQGRHQ